MRCMDQADILHSLSLIVRHYAAATLSLKLTRSFDACRLLVMGCMACVADAAMRVPACDRPVRPHHQRSPGEKWRPVDRMMGGRRPRE